MREGYTAFGTLWLGASGAPKTAMFDCIRCRCRSPPPRHHKLAIGTPMALTATALKSHKLVFRVVVRIGACARLRGACEVQDGALPLGPGAPGEGAACDQRLAPFRSASRALSRGCAPRHGGRSCSQSRRAPGTALRCLARLVARASWEGRGVGTQARESETR